MQIAEAFVAIRADADRSRFKADVERAVVAPSRAAGRKAGEEGGKELNDAFVKRASSLKGQLARLGLGLGFAALIRGSFQEASEAARAGAQVAAVIKSTGNVANTSAKEIDDLSTSIGKLDAIDNDLVKRGAALLLTFKAVRNEAGDGNDVFDRTLKVAADLQGALGTDLQGAVLQLGKALANPTVGLTALRRAGVDFTKQQLDQIKTLVKSGKLLDAQKIILKEVESQFGGTAKALADADPFQRFSVEVGEFKEQIGRDLLPAAQTIFEIGGRIFDVFAKLPQPLQVTALGLTGIAIAARPIRDVLGIANDLRKKFVEVTTASDGTRNATKQLAGAFGLLGAGVAVGTALVAVYDQLGGKAPDIERLTTATEAFLQSGLFEGQLGDTFGQDASKVGDFIKSLQEVRFEGDSIGGSFEKVGRVLTDPFSSRGATEVSKAQKAFAGLDQQLSDLVSSGKGDDARKLFDFIADAAAKQGFAVGEVRTQLPKYQAALDDTTLAQTSGVTAAKDHADAIEEEGTAAERAAAKLDALKVSLFGPQEGALAAAEATQSLTDAQRDLADLRDTAAGRGPQQAAALDTIRKATQRATEATEKQAEAVRSLEDARKELAEFESGSSKRIRDLEREQIVRRVVTTPEEARAKEIDLLQFDQQAGQERARLQDGIADAEQGVRSAADDVRDAQDEVRQANREREQQQIDAAGKIAEAERQVQDAALKIAEGYVDIVKEQGTATLGALAYRDAVLQAQGALSGLVDTQALLAALAPPPAVTAKGAAANRIGTSKLQEFATGGVVEGRPGEAVLVKAHAGETVTPAGQSAGSFSMTNNFHGGDVPTTTQLDAIARKFAIRIGLGGRRG